MKCINLLFTLTQKHHSQLNTVFQKIEHILSQIDGFQNAALFHNVVGRDFYRLQTTWTINQSSEDSLAIDGLKSALIKSQLINIVDRLEIELSQIVTNEITFQAENETNHANQLNDAFKFLFVRSKHSEEADYTKYASSNISDEQIDSYLESIQNYMTEEKPYLDKKMTLVRFAEELGIHPHHVSRVINEKLGHNFSTFVNENRVKHSIELLLDNLMDTYTISGIGNEAGFNSRSAFYNSFKKFTGMSPGDYINQAHHMMKAS